MAPARCRWARSRIGSTLPKSGAHRMLATLVELGWAAQDPVTGFYRLTMRLAILGQKFYVATGVPDICQPLLDRLASDSREFVRLAVVRRARIGLDRARARRRRERGPRLPAGGHERRRSPACHRERQGVACVADPGAGDPVRAARRRLRACGTLRAERRPHGRSAARRSEVDALRAATDSRSKKRSRASPPSARRSAAPRPDRA